MNTGKKLKRSRPLERSEEALSNRSPRAASTAGRGSKTPYRLSLAAKQSASVQAAWPTGRGRPHQTRGVLRCRPGGHGGQRHDRRAVAARAPTGSSDAQGRLQARGRHAGARRSASPSARCRAGPHRRDRPELATHPARMPCRRYLAQAG